MFTNRKGTNELELVSRIVGDLRQHDRPRDAALDAYRVAAGAAEGGVFGLHRFPGQLAPVFPLLAMLVVNVKIDRAGMRVDACSIDKPAPHPVELGEIRR